MPAAPPLPPQQTLTAEDVARAYEQYQRDAQRAQVEDAYRQQRAERMAHEAARQRQDYAQMLYDGARDQWVAAAAQLGPGMGAVGLGPGEFAPYMRGPSSDAVARARALLLRLLSPEQRRQCLAHGSFIETGSDGNSYVLDDRGIYRIDEASGERREYLCVLPELELGSPHEDKIIARLLHLRADAKGLRRKGNTRTLALPG